MTVSFTSTYRVPFSQPGGGITPSKKDALKALALKNGGIAPNFRNGNVKFSVRKKFDEGVKAMLKQFGFRQYEVVPLHNVPQTQIIDALEAKGRFIRKVSKP